MSREESAQRGGEVVDDYTEAHGGALADDLEGAVEKQLALKGFVRSSIGTPDLLIHYHASITNRIDVNRIDRQYGYCYEVECRAGASDYEAGTLLLDIVDTRTNRVIWRGWAQDTVEEALENPDRMAEQVDDVANDDVELVT